MEEMGHIGYKTDRHLEWYLNFKMQDKKNYNKKNKIKLVHEKCCSKNQTLSSSSKRFVMEHYCHF